MTPSVANLPITERQLAYARALAQRNQVVLHWETQQDRASLSRWIDQQAAATAPTSNRPTSKQVAFAERLARIKRIQVPDEYFRDRQMLSNWINSHC